MRRWQKQEPTQADRVAACLPAVQLYELPSTGQVAVAPNKSERKAACQRACFSSPSLPFFLKPPPPQALYFQACYSAPHRQHEEGGVSERRWEGRHSPYGPPGLLRRSAAPGADAQAHLQSVSGHHGQGSRRAPAPAPAPAAGRQRCCRWCESARRE
jgi:hypothetical protein